MSTIMVNHISKSFGQIKVLDDISLKVGEGEFYGLFGANGAGKTTLLKILTGQLSADSGEAWTAGYPVTDPIAVKGTIGIVPEAETPPTFLTAKEALELACRIRKLDEIPTRVNHWLKFFDVESKSDVLCRDLSKGQRQKIMLATAFIHEPRVLLLDEAFINLDPIYQRRLRDYLKRLSEEGRTIFMCTHILEIAEKLCTKVAVIDGGHIVAEGAIDELRSREGEGLEEIFMRAVDGENVHAP
jgi:ABC-2 type transport system ATP-binding protein